MTALYITLGIIAGLILIIYILLRISVCAYVDMSDNGINIIVKYLWIELFKLDKSSDSDVEPEVKIEDIEKPISKSDIKASSQKQDDDQNEELMGNSDEDKPKKSVKEIIEEYKQYLPVAKKALRKLLKLIRFYDLDFSLTVGDQDAYEAAMKFGKLNTLVYSVLALLCCAFTVNIKHTEIKCNFDDAKTTARFATTIKVRPSAVLALAIYLGINYLKIRHNQKKKEKLLNKEKENSNVRQEQ